MKNNDLSQWLPCQSYCQMNGAAAAVLSFKNANVVFNGPRWCSVIAERELMAYDRTLSERLYCSHVEQADLLFGTGERIREIVEDQKRENPNTNVLAVLTSCSVGLIGDDVDGIVGSLEQSYPVIVLDAGGLTGLFEEGYQAAMTEVIKIMDLQKTASIHPNRVNLLGYCGYYPDSSGDLIELKRLLQAAGFELGICPGESGLALQDLKTIPSAALNIVLSPELGLQTAKYLQEKIGQKFAVLPVPYGLNQTMKWLKDIGEELSMIPDIKKLETEVRVMEENIAEQVDMLKRMVTNLTYKRAILALPYSRAKSLANALQNEILEVEKIKFEIQGNYMGDELKTDESEGNKSDWLAADYQLLFGSSADRVRTGNFTHTIYLNMYKTDSRIRRRYKTFAGIEGWGILIQEIVEKTLALYYWKNEIIF